MDQKVQKGAIEKAKIKQFQWHFIVRVLANLMQFFGFWLVRTSPGSSLRHDQAKPNQYRPLKALLQVFLTIFWTKIPKSKWIWFEDTYPLTKDIVRNKKIPIPPFGLFKKHHFGSADMCFGIHQQLNIIFNVPWVKDWD